MPAYVHDNLLIAALTGSPPDGAISASTEDSVYTLENLFDELYPVPFRFTVDTGGHIEVDFGSAVAFDTVGILGHNLATLSSGTVKAGASPNPGSTVATLAYREQDIWADTESQSARYVRVTLAGTTEDEVVQIGELVIGLRVALPRAAFWTNGDSSFRQSILEEGVTLVTNGGHPYDYELYETGRIEQEFFFPQSEYAAFELFRRRTVRVPFLWIPNVNEDACMYGRRDRGFIIRHTQPASDAGTVKHWHRWPCNITAESLGLITTA